MAAIIPNAAGISTASQANKNPINSEVKFTSQGQTPQQILSNYNEDDWEQFVEEAMYGNQPAYVSIQRFSGPGDKGRDVACYVSNPIHTSEWDSFQCKQYGHPLHPGDVWIELGKLCFYTFRGDYPVPRQYRFAAPYEVGPTLKDLFLHPNKLREELIGNWSKACEQKITDAGKVSLEGPFLDYVKKFNFSIVSFVPVLVLIQQHKKTPHWTTRFKFCPPERPPSITPPVDPETSESVYLRQLLNAYADAEKQPFSSAIELGSFPKLIEHFKRSRQWFYQAESLNRFSRESYPVGEFEKIKKQVHDGIIEVVEQQHENGLKRVDATTGYAGQLRLGNSDLVAHVEAGDMKGLCHHLANDGKLEWVPKS